MSRLAPLLLLAFGVAVAGCPLDPQNLPDLTFGVDAKDVWRDGSKPVVPAVAGETRILLTNNLDDTVSVVSLDKLLAGGTDAELDRFVVGLFPLEREGPHHLATSADGHFGYVGISNFVPLAGSGPHGNHGTGTDDGRVLLVDLDTQRTLKNVRIDPNPGDVRLTPDGKRLLATHFDQAKVLAAAERGVFSGPDLDARLAIVDVATFEREALIDLCPAAHGIAITDDSKFAVCSCRSDEAAVVDLTALTVTRVVLLDEPGTAAAPVCDPYAVTLSTDGQTAWVSCYASGALIGVDVATASRGPTIAQEAGRAIFGDTAADGTLAIAIQDSDGVVFAKDDAVVDFIALPPAVCELPHTVKYIDEDSVLLVVCEGNKSDPGAIIALDLASKTVLGRTPVGRFPDDVALQVKP
jgi:DNA-binding beta-propeller fold protein YncE